MKKIKATKEQAESVRYLLAEAGWTKIEILSAHEDRPEGWIGEAESLNGLRLEALNALLFTPNFVEIEKNEADILNDIYTELLRLRGKEKKGSETYNLLDREILGMDRVIDIMKIPGKYGFGGDSL